MFDPQLVQLARDIVFRTESDICAKHKLINNWTTVVDFDRPPTEHFHVQRMGCEPTLIVLSGRWIVTGFTNIDLRERNKFRIDFRVGFLGAMRDALNMQRRSVFSYPAQSKTTLTRDDRVRVKFNQLRDTHSILEPHNFRVEFIAIVTELVSGENQSVAIPQSSTLTKPYDLEREGKRQLSERILNDESMIERIRLSPHRVDPDPESISIRVSRENKATVLSRTISYDAMDGNLIPVEA